MDKISPSKIKALLKCQPQEYRKCINYIRRFTAKLTTTCELLFKLLRESEPMVWKDDYQVTFEKIKTYLLNPPVLVPRPGHLLLVYLAVRETYIGYVLGQHYKPGKKD